MELLRLAKDKWQRRKTPIEYDCHVMNEVARNDDELNKLLSRFILFTYREKFTPLPKSSCTSDKGWGCLARSCQMLLAHAIFVYRPRDFNLHWFCDTEEAPFSIHNMAKAVTTGHSYKPDYWSPSQGCEAIRATVASANSKKLIKSSFSVFVAAQGTLGNADVLFRLEEMGALLVLVPVRLSARRHINQQQFMGMEHILRAPGSVGIVGGVPNRSYYIIGVSGQRVLYLDPHIDVRPAMLDISRETGLIENAQTLPAVAWDRIDTSLLFGFFVNSAADWGALSQHLLDPIAAGIIFIEDGVGTSKRAIGKDTVIDWSNSSDDDAA